MRRALLASACLVAAIAASSAPAAGGQDAPRLPELAIEAPEDLAAVRARLEGFDRARLLAAMRLAGLDDPGPPIRVLLAPEGSELERAAPAGIAGYAVSRVGAVVIFPERSPVYPDDSLEDVLHHEVAHILVARAAGGRPVPRWFHEGVAMAAERTWGLDDRAWLLVELSFRGAVPLRRLDDLFDRDRRSTRQAYAISGAFVRDLLRRHGPEAPGAILRGVAGGMRFDRAFADATGVRLGDAEAAFWESHTFWIRWVPWLTSASALWMGVTLLGLYAIYRLRRRRAARRAQWAQEEGEGDWDAGGAADETGTDGRPGRA